MKKYRILLEEKASEYETSVIELFLEVDGQTYRITKTWTDEEEKLMSEGKIRKIRIGECFRAISNFFLD